MYELCQHVFPDENMLKNMLKNHYFFIIKFMTILNNKIRIKNEWYSVSEMYRQYSICTVQWVSKRCPIVTAAITHAQHCLCRPSLPSLVPIIGVAAVIITVLMIIATNRSRIIRIDKGWDDVHVDSWGWGTSQSFTLNTEPKGSPNPCKDLLKRLQKGLKSCTKSKVGQIKRKMALT